jgi:hypothetical protein
VQRPFSLYLGWISVATIANFSAVLSLVWDGRPLSPVAWTVSLMLVAAALALVMLARHGDYVYAAVIVWALAGIWVKQAALAPIVAGAGLAIAAVALGALALPMRRLPRLAEGAR